VALKIKKSENINSLYVWGSFAENYEKPNFRVRDIDIIATTDFDSGDLAAIDNDILRQKFSEDELEDQGYNPVAIKFSNEFLSSKKQNIDHWVISSDNKLLHWGPIPSSKEESEALNEEASNHAYNRTGCCRDKIHKASEEVRENWYEEHHSYLKKIFTDMPSGWYLSDTEDIEKVLDSAIEF